MLVELSKAQDIEAGDGTTSVVVLAGALLDACTKLLDKGIHPTIIADTFLRCAAKAQEILGKIAIPVSLDDRDSLIRAASTSLSSKVVSNNSQVLSPIAVDAVLRVADLEKQQVDLRDIHIVKQIGGDRRQRIGGWSGVHEAERHEHAGRELREEREDRTGSVPPERAEDGHRQQGDHQRLPADGQTVAGGAEVYIGGRCVMMIAMMMNGSHLSRCARRSRRRAAT